MSESRLKSWEDMVLSTVDRLPGKTGPKRLCPAPSHNRSSIPAGRKCLKDFICRVTGFALYEKPRRFCGPGTGQARISV